MQLCTIVSVLLLLAITTAVVTFFGIKTSSSPNGRDPSSVVERSDVLDNAGKVSLLWRTNFARRVVTFEISAETTGFVGFGLSTDGGMTGADIVIGGVHENGSAYFSDRHGTGNWEPLVDASQDWTLLQARENATHTVLVVERPLNTCDEEGDLPIDNSTTNLIWAFGPSDEVQYHGSSSTQRGAYMVNLLDPPVAPPSAFPGVHKWRVTSDAVMPTVSTFYGCTIHKAPRLAVKHHIVGYETVLSSSVAQEHVHHWMVRECVPSAGAPLLEPLLERWVGQPPQDCFNFSEYQLCSANPITWGIRGKPIVFPEEAGLAFGGHSGAESAESRYYLLEVHYNNPNLLQGVRFEAGVDVYYTPELRKYDVGSLIVGYAVDVSQVIPPGSPAFVNSVHCDPACLHDYVPPADGALVFNVLLHAHLAARKMRLRHFRGGTELPWLDNNEHYQFNYQQSRPFRIPVPLRHGDQLTLECSYETTGRRNATFGGISTAHEMCEAYLLYYPVRATSGYCGSHVPLPSVLRFFGVEAVEGDMHDPFVSSPAQYSGRRFLDVVNNSNWTEERKAAWQQVSRFTPHTTNCFPAVARAHGATEGRLGYPSDLINVYEHVSSCEKGE